MKRRILPMLLSCALLLNSSLTAFAADMSYVSGSDALTAVKDGGAYIVDVRNTARHEAENLDYLGSTWQPVFDANNSVDSDEAVQLQEEFVANMTELTADADHADKNIYVLCNSGARGAQKATELLTEQVGVSPEKISTITNGAKGLEIRYAFLNVNNAVSGADAVAAVDDSNVVILDVRTKANYDLGHLKNSISLPVFTDTGVVETGDDELAKEFTAYVNENKASLEGKSIYVLCNSGSRGARAATALLADAGIDKNSIYTITGGAKDDAVKAAFVTAPAEVTEYKFVSGSDAVAAAKSGSAYIVDVRSSKARANGNLDALGSTVIPQSLFDDNNKLDTEEAIALENAFTSEIQSKLTEDKPIYILCNSGARGAQKATQLLANLGYNVSTGDDGKVFTIKNGAKGLEVQYAMIGTDGNPVDGKTAVAAVGKSDVTILDVRASGNYASGHLKGSVSTPLFTSNGVVQTGDDDLAKAFTDYVTKNKTTLEKNEIYILCNSGASGARAATALLKAAGYNLDKVHTITGGAKNADVKSAAIYVSDTRAINALSEKDVLILDVRSAETYKKGHLKGSLSLPLFDADNNLPDDLATAFTEYVNAHKADFEGKTIYVLCNSGARGAEKATKLLKEAGITNVFTIEGGAKSEVIQSHFVTDTETPADTKDPADSNTSKNPSASNKNTDKKGTTATSKTTKTGDTAPVVPMTLAMLAALCAIAAVSKKKFVK